MFSKRIIVASAALTALLVMLSACGPAAPTEDPNLKITEVYSTVQAELTRVYLLTPSSTPTPTPTQTPTLSPVTPTLDALQVSATATATKSGQVSNTGDNAAYDNDITIPDYSIIKPGATFDKTWSIKNTGTTTWTKDYQLMYLEGPQPAALFVKLTKDVAPGELVQITVRFVAPTALGAYTGWWQMYNAGGYRFGEPVSLRFNVGNETPTPTSPAGTGTTTPSTTGTVTETPTVTPT